MLIKAKARTTRDIEDQIINGTAKEVCKAGFILDGDQECKISIKFYRLCGEVIRVKNDRYDTTVTYEFVKGEDKELFNARYN